MSEGRRLNLGRSSRKTIGLAFCTQFSLLNFLSALAPGGYCPETDLFGGISSHPQLLLGGVGWRVQSKFPDWQISNFFTRLQTLRAGVGAGGEQYVGPTVVVC